MIEEGNFIAPNTVVRNGEMVQVELGLGVYDNDFLLRSRNSRSLEVSRKGIWLSQETEELFQRITQENKSMLITGDPGVGKSTLIYGIRALCRERQINYCYIDGHYRTTAALNIERKVRLAQRKHGIVFWDSMDYLIGKTKKIKKGSNATHINRSTQLLHTVENFIDSGGIVVGTSHSEPWLMAYANQELMNGLWKQATAKMELHTTIGIFDQPEDAKAFYRTTGISEQGSAYLASLYESSIFRDSLHGGIFTDLISAGYNNEEILVALDSPRVYKNAKLLTLGEDKLAKDLREHLEDFISDRIDESIFLKEYLTFNLIKNRETKRIMGIKPET